ncbi:CdaR family transcriptional regulator [Amycolatopsis sp. Hca4]|uniref:PucR family transcriptional regulator n=1 Tax=Amycolatopsis sp. Hca4 TaxID=2742131 RepID=UPI00158FC7B7|nr:helix-turn-helix domain-containing protein [Amycolatopsis sp. Hca4]QKV73829.1 helix-turn-helix domain-containing protein [Amycolatopsis sp. Hca4]
MIDDAIVTAHVERIADAFIACAGDLIAEVVDVYARELPHLVLDDEAVVNLLSASLLQNLGTVLRVFRHGLDPAQVRAPAAAIEYARRLAQRGTPVIDLVRAYFLACNTLIAHVPSEAVRQPVDSDVLAAVIRRYLADAFVFIDQVTQQVVTAYQEEREHWLLNRSAVRARRVRELLASDRVDIDPAEKALGYRLRGRHLAAFVWHTETDASARSLETATTTMSQRLPASGAPLVVPSDEHCLWVWFPLSATTPFDDDVLHRATDVIEPHIRVAFGDPGTGVTGFRSSHDQARRVHALAVLVDDQSAHRHLAFRDVGALALMTVDLPATRSWVARTLGSLATDDAQHHRLRETLLAFLSTGGSFTAAATALTIHKNSVQYRVRKAEQVLQRPIADNRIDLELALKLCQLVGKTVLTPGK